MLERLRVFHQAGSKERPYYFFKGWQPDNQFLERESMIYARNDEKKRRTVIYCEVGGKLQKWVRVAPGQWQRE